MDSTGMAAQLDHIHNGEDFKVKVFVSGSQYKDENPDKYKFDVALGTRASDSELHELVVGKEGKHNVYGTLVFACGPAIMCDKAQAIAASEGFDFHVETFAL